tara:strand:- start:251 stop:1057 length:807 start_codon:yes stop_codon:yes gene_type:complete
MKKKRLPLVSVIMNSHNGSVFLNRSIQSLLGQKYKKWELIFWDNCSKDDSKKKIKGIKDERIKYFYSSTFHSLYHSRNLAIARAKGDYICFLDVDDEWKSNKLIKQIEKMNYRNFDIIFSNYSVKDKLKKKFIKKVRKKNIDNKNITQELLNNYFLGIVTVMVKREIFIKYKFDKKYNIIGDFDFFIKSSIDKKFYFIKESLAIYNIHESNYSTKNLTQYIKELTIWIKKNEKPFLRRQFNFDNLKFFLMKLRIKNIINSFKLLFWGM